MTTSGLCPKSAAAAGAAIDPARLHGTNINPVTGLATDYLNHFNEAIMLLEMLPSAPECKDDLLAWRPMSYPEHFAASKFRHRDLAIAAYELADPVFRQELDAICQQMNQILTEAQDGLQGELARDTIRILAEATAHWLRQLVARAGALINGESEAAAAAEPATQEAIDALFDREVESAVER